MKISNNHKPEKRPINQSDIARMLNVSKMTVSKALGNLPDISIERKKQIQDLARELGYVPNVVARNLSLKKTFTIGVVVPKLTHSFYTACLNNIYDAASIRGYEIILMVSSSPVLFKEQIKKLISMRVDGLIVGLSSYSIDEETKKMIKQIGLPLVVFDQMLENTDFSCVTIDNQTEAEEGIGRLVRSGYNRIAYLAGHLNNRHFRDRFHGYLAGLRQNGLPIRNEWIIECKDTIEGGYRGFQKLWELDEKPNAILAVNDRIAFGAFQAIKQNSLELMRDLGLLVFLDLETERPFSKRMMIIRKPTEICAEKAVELLVDHINQPQEFKPKKIMVKAMTFVPSTGDDLDTVMLEDF